MDKMKSELLLDIFIYKGWAMNTKEIHDEMVKLFSKDFSSYSTETSC